MAVHKAMNAMKYDGGGFGNHEFNYGLPLLSQITNTDFGVTGVTKPAGACGGPSYPLVLSNVTSVASQWREGTVVVGAAVVVVVTLTLLS